MTVIIERSQSFKKIEIDESELSQRIRLNSVIRFYYPHANYAGIKPRLESRCVLVKSIRIIAAEPLDEFTLHEDPTLRRGSSLITGICLDKGGERSFYLESMVDLEVIDASKLATMKLKVIIHNDKHEIVNRMELDDPRERFCTTYNTLPGKARMTAIPIGNVA